MRLTLGLASRSGPVDSFAVCPHGRYLSALLASGLLVVYDISSALSAAQNRAAGRSSGVNFYPVESTVASAGGAQAAAPAGDQPPPVKAGRKTSKEGSRHVPMGGLIEGKSWEASLRAKEPPLPSKPCSRADYRRRKKAEIAALPEVPSVSETKLYDILRGYGEFPAKVLQTSFFTSPLQHLFVFTFVIHPRPPLHYVVPQVRVATDLVSTREL